MAKRIINQEAVLLVLYLNGKGLGNFQIAEKTTLSEGTVSQILNRRGRYAKMVPKKWVFKQPKTRKKIFLVTQEMVDEVIEMNQQGVYSTGIAHATGLSYQTVRYILGRKVKFAKMVPENTIILDNRWRKQN